jgi:hypothetical protein
MDRDLRRRRCDHDRAVPQGHPCPDHVAGVEPSGVLGRGAPAPYWEGR